MSSSNSNQNVIIGNQNDIIGNAMNIALEENVASISLRDDIDVEDLDKYVGIGISVSYSKSNNQKKIIEKFSKYTNSSYKPESEEMKQNIKIIREINLSMKEMLRHVNVDGETSKETGETLIPHISSLNHIKKNNINASININILNTSFPDDLNKNFKFICNTEIDIAGNEIRLPVFSNYYGYGGNNKLFLFPFYNDGIHYLLCDENKLIGNIKVIVEYEINLRGYIPFRDDNEYARENGFDLETYYYDNSVIINKFKTTEIDTTYSALPLPPNHPLREKIAYPNGYTDDRPSVYPDYDIILKTGENQSEVTIDRNVFSILHYTYKNKKMIKMNIIHFSTEKSFLVVGNRIGIFSNDRDYLIIYIGKNELRYDDENIHKIRDKMGWYVYKVELLESILESPKNDTEKLKSKLKYIFEFDINNKDSLLEREADQDSGLYASYISRSLVNLLMNNVAEKPYVGSYYYKRDICHKSPRLDTTWEGIYNNVNKEQEFDYVMGDYYDKETRDKIKVSIENKEYLIEDNKNNSNSDNGNNSNNNSNNNASPEITSSIFSSINSRDDGDNDAVRPPTQEQQERIAYLRRQQNDLLRRIEQRRERIRREIDEYRESQPPEEQDIWQ